MSNVKCIWLVFLLTLAVRLAAAANTCAISADGPEYVKVAKWYLAGEYGKAIRHAYHPLYPILVAAFFSLIGNWELAGQAISVLFSALTAFPLYWLARRLFEERHALVAGVLYAFWPFAATTSVSVLTTGLFIGFFSFAVWASVEAVATRHLRYFPLVGLFCGLAYLVRIDGLVLVAGFALGSTIQFLREVITRRCHVARDAVLPAESRSEISPVVPPRDVRSPDVQRPLLRLVLGSCLAAVFFLLVAAPFLLAIRRATGKWTLTMKMNPAEIGEMLAIGTTDGKEALEQIKEKSLSSVGLMAMDFAEAGHYLVVFVLGVGLLQRRIRAKDRLALLMMWAIIAVNLLMLFRFGVVAERMSRRYHIGLIFLCLPWAAAGLAFVSTVLWRLCARLRRKGTRAVPQVSTASSPGERPEAAADIRAASVREQPVIPAKTGIQTNQAVSMSNRSPACEENQAAAIVPLPPAGTRPPFSVNWQSVAIGLLVAVCTFVPKTFAPTAWDKQDEIAAAEFIWNKAKRKPVRIVTYLERVPFYAEGEQIALGAAGATLGAVADYARAHGIEFICVDKNVTRITAGFYSDAEKAQAAPVFASSTYSDGKNEVRVYVVK
jgi:hypothetical protein